MSFEKELGVARLAVQRASLVTKRIRRRLRTSDEINKDDDTPVTIADLTAQALVIGAIHHVFPDDSFLAEESATVLRKDEGLANRVWSFVSKAKEYSGDYLDEKLWTPKTKEEMLDIIDLGKGEGGPKGRIWILDPIDGTITYMKGQQYAVCLCLIKDGKKIVSAQGCPHTVISSYPMTENSVDLSEPSGFIVSAIAGGGAFKQNLREGDLGEAFPVIIRRSPQEMSEWAHIESLDSTSMAHDLIKSACEELSIPYPGTDIWASEMKYIALAIGGCDVIIRLPAYPSHRTAVWDHASGMLIAEECGLKCTDAFGRAHDFGRGRRLYGNWGDVICSPESHEKVMKVVKELLQKQGVTEEDVDAACHGGGK